MMLCKGCIRVGITLTFADCRKVGKESRYNNSMEDIFEIILGLTVGPYMCIWDYFNSSSNTGHTSGLCSGLMFITSFILICIHLVIITALAIPYIIFF